MEAQVPSRTYRKTTQSSSALFQCSSHQFDGGVFAQAHTCRARPSPEPALASPCRAPTVRCDTPEDCVLQGGIESHYNVVLVRAHTPHRVWSPSYNGHLCLWTKVWQWRWLWVRGGGDLILHETRISPRDDMSVIASSDGRRLKMGTGTAPDHRAMDHRTRSLE